MKPARWSGTVLVGTAMLKLVAVRARLRIRGYDHIVRRYSKTPIVRTTSNDEESIAVIVESVATATALLGGRWTCLHRSLVCADMLKSIGLPAKVVLGYRNVIGGGHAWVEVNDCPVDVHSRPAAAYTVVSTI